MLNLPQRPKSDMSLSFYNSLGLKDLPFPTDPVVNPGSPDPRLNGSIYAESPVKQEIEKFENLLIRPHDFQNRVKLASLWAKGDTQSGRGMGKTALLRFFQQRINCDWGVTEFGGQFSAVVVYVAFPDQVDRRYMEQLAWAALVDICENNVLDASLAALRMDVLEAEQVDSIVNARGALDYGNLLDDEVLNANGICSSDVNDLVEHSLINKYQVQPYSAHALSNGKFEEYLRGLRKDGNLKPYYVPRDTKALNFSRTLLFSDIVNYLRAAGFAGGYLFIDDIENLVDQMTRRQRLQFAKEFGLCTVRPGYANTTYGFFSSVLTTHQSSSVPLAQAWNEAGLAGMARLDPDAPTSVELPLPTEDQAQEILIAHLDHFRINLDEKGMIKPFTQEGIDTLVNANSHPRVLLSNAARVVRHAAENKATEINVETVKEAIQGTLEQPLPDITEGLEDAL